MYETIPTQCSSEFVNVHVYNSPFRHETRILKITKSLRDRALFNSIVILSLYERGLAEREVLDDTRVVCRLRTPFDVRPHTALTRFLRLGSWCIQVFWYILARRRELVCINCHSLTLLPLCVLLKWLTACKLIYDTHELETETLNCTGLRRLLAKVAERVFIAHADAVVVVCQSIADWYKRTYGIHNITVIQNAPDTRVLRKAPLNLRGPLSIPPHRILFLYLGVIAHGRCIDLLLDTFREQHRCDVLFVGYGEMVPAVEAAARNSERIHFMPAVPPNDICSLASAADVGVCLLEDKCLSYRMAMPNKLLEYTISGLPVLANDGLAVGNYVKARGCGWTIPLNHEALSSFVNGLQRKDIEQKRARALQAAADIGWHHEERSLERMYHDLGYRQVDARL